MQDARSCGILRKVKKALGEAMPSIIKLDGVSKRFSLHHERPRSFQEALVNLFHRRGNWREDFWALKDVSLEVYPGETLGIIGQNGSGKSTLLKLMTRVLEPTEGTIMIGGRVSALIELGAGFHPDLTGRENIYLNGSILGFTKREMDRKFDDIVAFSGLERFLDTPIKHYSSGMYARLGFAVAIHVDPDILITDEVLAVGDQEFRQKCLDQFWSFKRQQKTILMVSHDLQSVQELCYRAIWLDNGRLRAEGDPQNVVAEYLRFVESPQSRVREAARTAS